MASRTCPDCGMRHDRPRWQATPDNRPARTELDVSYFGCALVILAVVVVSLWAMFLLWPA